MRKKGFTLVEIMIVVAIIGLLAAIAIPSFMKSRTVSQANTCVNNLRLIDHAKEQWALATGKSEGYELAGGDQAQISQYIRGGEPTCPVSTADPYAYNDIGSAPTCSIGTSLGEGAHHVLPGFEDADGS